MEFMDMRKEQERFIKNKTYIRIDGLVLVYLPIIDEFSKNNLYTTTRKTMS